MSKKTLFIFFLALIFSFFIFLIFIFYPRKKASIEQKIITTTNKIEAIKEEIIPVPTKILESGLPNQHLIKTVFIPQSPEKNWDQPWQDACEESSLLTGYYFYKNQSPSMIEIKNKVLEIIEYEKLQGWGTSINLDKVQQIYNKFLGLNSQIISDPTIEDIKKSISKDNPVLIPAAGKILYKENKYFNNGGPEYHALVVLGYDDIKQKFIVHDVGTQYGAYFKYSYNLLMESIHDFPISNDKKDILNGDKRILILSP